MANTLRVRANPGAPSRARVIGHPAGLQPFPSAPLEEGTQQVAEPGSLPLAEAAQMRFEELAMQEVADQMVRRSQGAAETSEGADFLAERYSPRIEREILRRLHESINFQGTPIEEGQ